MADQPPRAGQVIPFAYLWRRQFEAGEESGRKQRPCVIVVAVDRSPEGPVRVAVAPITSQAPDESRTAVQMPSRVRAHLNLDAERSWVICDEFNDFDWPGVAIERTPTGASTYGRIPDALLEQIRTAFKRAADRGRLKPVPRSR